MIRTKSEDAVSPVIGVMLLLVVTVVIAAVVAAFAGGIGVDAEPVPSTVVDVVSISDGYYEQIGDKLNTDTYPDLDINDYYAYDAEWNQFEESSKSSADAFYRVYYYKITGEKIAIRTHDGPPKSWAPDKPTWSSFKPYQGNVALFEQYVVAELDFKSEPTVTLSCLHGDSLDLSKVSIQVTSIKGTTVEIPQKTFSGLLSVGDTVTLKLGSDIGGNQGSIVDVVVLYGNHKIATKEQMKITRG